MLSVCMLNVGSIGIDIGASRLFYLRDLKVYVIYLCYSLCYISLSLLLLIIDDDDDDDDHNVWVNFW